MELMASAGCSRLIIFFSALIVSLVGDCYAAEKKQLILVGVDGFQVARYQTLLGAGKLPNFTSLISGSGWGGTAVITGHASTETLPGNAELHSGLGSTVTSITGNVCSKSLPAGVSTFERWQGFDPAIQFGLVYGKGTCYIPNAVLANAKPLVAWWHDRTTYPQTTYVGANCADSRDVATKALEFISAHVNDSFYLVVYFGAPDCAGHYYGTPSSGYDNALMNVDAGLGILRNHLSQLSLTTTLLVSADHGWNEGTTGHGTPDANTLNIPLITNNAPLISRIYSQEKRKQCDIAPTILSFFGMKESQYPDIVQFGCGSMAAIPAAPAGLRTVQ